MPDAHSATGSGFAKRGADRDGNGAAGGWGDPDSWFGINGANPALGTQGSGPAAVNGSSDNEIYGFHVGGANVLLGDGSVRLLQQNISLAMLSAFVSRQAARFCLRKFNKAEPQPCLNFGHQIFCQSTRQKI